MQWQRTKWKLECKNGKWNKQNKKVKYKARQRKNEIQFKIEMIVLIGDGWEQEPYENPSPWNYKPFKNVILFVYVSDALE